MINTTCPSCGQEWAAVPSLRKAHPGHQTAPRAVRVPCLDTDGNPHGYRTTMTSRWVASGDSALMVTTDDGSPRILHEWSCLCGVRLHVTTPAIDDVPCTHNAGNTGMCRVRANQANPPTDRYVNPRHGAACPCCGHQGVHGVRRDGLGHRPACLTSTPAVTA